MTTKRLFKCPVATCPYEAEGRAMGGHIGGHKRRGELPKDSKVKGIPIRRITQKQTPKPVTESIPEPSSVPDVTPIQVADSLLQQVVSIINSDGMLQSQLKSAVARIKNLEEDVDRLGQEKERILKIHNEQAKRKEFTTSEELLEMAKLPPRRRE